MQTFDMRPSIALQQRQLLRRPRSSNGARPPRLCHRLHHFNGPLLEVTTHMPIIKLSEANLHECPHIFVVMLILVIQLCRQDVRQHCLRQQSRRIPS